jgi:hypothetical protein
VSRGEEFTGSVLKNMADMIYGVYEMAGGGDDGTVGIGVGASC